jgi:hypothetical protein
MVKQADGTWMAPPEVVAQITKQYLEIYDWARSKDEAYIFGDEAVIRRDCMTYLAGDVLMECLGRRDLLLDRLYDQNHQNKVIVLRVKGFSPDGLTAVVDSERLDVKIKYYDLSRKSVYATRTVSRCTMSVQVVFSPVVKRWQEQSIVSKIF